MFKNFFSSLFVVAPTLVCVCFLPAFVWSSPVENPPKSETQSDTAPSGKSAFTSKREEAKFAAPVSEQEYARHYNKIFPILQHKVPFMLNKPFVQPIVEHLQPSAIKPVAPIYPSVPVISESVYTKPSLPFIPEHVFTKPSIPIIPESVYTKPSVPYVGGSQYAISSQIIHKPVVTDKVEIIRRPVISEVLQVIHKPSVTEEQKVIKIPNYVAHVVQKPIFNSIKNEFQGHPILLPAQHYSHVDKLQYLPSVTTEVVQVPHQHIPSHGSIGYGSTHGVESSLKPSFLGSLGLGGASYGVSPAVPSYNFGSYYGSGSSLPSYFGSSQGLGSSIPSYVGHGVGSSVPSYLGSSQGVSSSVPSYLGSGYGIGSSVPSYVGSSYGIGSTTPSYVGSSYGIGSAIPSYGIGSAIPSYGIGSSLQNVGISSSPFFGTITSAGHGGESEGVVNTYIEPAPSCKSDDCKLTSTTAQLLTPEYSVPVAYTPALWYDPQSSSEYVVSLPSGKSNEVDVQEQPEVFYVPSSPLLIDSKPQSSALTSMAMSSPEMDAYVRGMVEKIINNSVSGVSVDSRKVTEEKPPKRKSNNEDADGQSKKPTEEKPLKAKSNSEDDSQEGERPAVQSKVDVVKSSLKTFGDNELGEVEKAVHELRANMTKKQVDTESSPATVQESSPRAA